jgi:hypothetical protein
MVRKSLLFALLLFAVYSLFISFVKPHWSIPQHQWQENRVKAEKYLYEDNSNKNVIVGTSLSCRLIMDSLPNIFNLALGGQSAFDGLYIIRNRGTFPNTVFIEMNYILKEESKSFLTSINNPLLSTIKKQLLSVREDKQPIAALGDIINIRATKPLFKLYRSGFAETHSISDKDDNKNLFNELIKEQEKNYKLTPNPKYLEETFTKLSKEVDLLKNNGVRVIFFEVPVNERLYNLPMPQLVRKEFFKYFPSNQFKYIIVPDCKGFTTSDGIHLVDDGAKIFTHFFKTSSGVFIN